MTAPCALVTAPAASEQQGGRSDRCAAPMTTDRKIGTTNDSNGVCRSTTVGNRRGDQGDPRRTRTVH